jgi:hypothetical protein
MNLGWSSTAAVDGNLRLVLMGRAVLVSGSSGWRTLLQGANFFLDGLGDHRRAPGPGSASERENPRPDSRSDTDQSSILSADRQVTCGDSHRAGQHDDTETASTERLLLPRRKASMSGRDSGTQPPDPNGPAPRREGGVRGAEDDALSGHVLDDTPLRDPAHRTARWVMVLAPLLLVVVVFLLLRLSTG